MEIVENIAINKMKPYLIILVIGVFCLLLTAVVIYSAASSSFMFFENLKNIFSCTSVDCSAVDSASSEEEANFYRNIITAKDELKTEGIVNPDIALFTATLKTISNYDSEFDYTALSLIQIKDLIKSNYIQVTTLNCVKNATTYDTISKPSNYKRVSFNENELMQVSNIYDNSIAYEIDETTGEPIAPEDENVLPERITCSVGEECVCPDGYTKESENLSYEQNTDQYKTYLKSFLPTVLSSTVFMTNEISMNEAEKNALLDKIIAEIYTLRDNLLQEAGPSADLAFFMLPIDTSSGCTVTSSFGFRFDPITGKPGTHQGIDVTANSSPGNEPIYAIADGIIAVVRDGVPGRDDFAGCGNYVYIDHNIDGIKYQSKYCHLKVDSIPDTFKVGSSVLKGNRIGTMGTTGYSTGIHLHFVITADDKPVDPTGLFNMCSGLINRD